MFKRHFHFFFFLVLALTITTYSRAWAATFNVSDPAQLQAALASAAANGESDVIQVGTVNLTLQAPLTFNSSENFSLTINGAGRDLTILNGIATTQLLSITTTGTAGNVTIRGVSFRNGTTAGNGGALNIAVAGAAVTVEDCRVENSSTTSGNSVGGGASITGDTGTLTVRSSIFTGNSSTGNVGGLYLGTVSGMIQLQNCSFEENRVANSGSSDYFGDGGGAMLYSEGTSRAMVTGNSFRENVATGGSNPDGGGLMTYQLGERSEVTLENNFFIGNSAGLGGGGCILRLNAGGAAVMRNNSFSDNRSIAGSGAGAQIYCSGGSLTYSGNTHSGNQSGEDGGGAWINQLSGDASVLNNLFSSNRSAGNGGGLYVTSESALINLSRNVFNTNVSGGDGGGLSLATAGGGVTIAHNTCYGNNASQSGGGINLYFDQRTVTSVVRNNVLWHDTPNEFDYSLGSDGPAVVMTYSDVENGTGNTWFGTGCIALDPLFTNPAAGTFTLQWQNYPESGTVRSPCIDTADPTSAVDSDGTRADMGALAFYQNTPSINISGILLTGAQALQSGDTFTVTVNASGAGGVPVYYQFYYCPNYGTDAYLDSPWTVVQAYSTLNRANYRFDQAGNYVIVVRVVTDPAHEPVSPRIVGCAVSVGMSSGQVGWSSFSLYTTGSPAAGTSVPFSVAADASGGLPLYYQFYYRNSYGTNAYDSAAWVLAQCYSTQNQASLRFPEPGDYVVVVRAVTNPYAEPTALPVIGGIVSVR